MLPPFIIEQIRKREQDERKRYDQPQLEIPPVHSPARPARPALEESEDGQRGITIVELL